MKYLLRVDVSPRGGNSHCRRAGNTAAERIMRRYGIPRIVERDLSASPLLPIDEDYIHAMHSYMSREASTGVAILQQSEQLIEELDGASALMIATPVYNYTVPGTLKTWIDLVVRFGRTFTSTPRGKVGLLRDRPTVIVSASGGMFSGDSAAQPDFFVPYLNAVLATIGITSVRHVRLEGLAHGETAVAAAYASAAEALQAL